MSSVPDEYIRTRHPVSWAVIWIAVLVVGGAAVTTLLIFRGVAATPWMVCRLVFHYTVSRITDASGWNSNVVKGVVTLALIPLGLAVFEMVRWRGASRTRRRVAQVVFALYIGAFYFTMALATAGNHGTINGGVTKWYSLTPEGIREFDADQVTSAHPVDPKYLVPLRPETADVVASIEMQKRGVRPERVDASTPGGLQFFDSRTGMPRIWYYRTPSGQYDLFSAPGFHPQFNEPLRPVTEAIVNDILAASAKTKQDAAHFAADLAARRLADARSSRQQRYLGSHPPTGAWIAAIRDGHPDSRTATTIASSIGGGSVFADAFVADGLAERLATGAMSILDDLGLTRAERVLVVTLHVDTRHDDAAPDAALLTSNVTLSAWIDRPLGGTTRTIAAVGTGVGFHSPDAEAMALDRALQQLKEQMGH